MRRGGRKREREGEEKNRRVRRAGERTAECGETSAGKSQLRGMSVSTVEGQHGNELSAGVASKGWNLARAKLASRLQRN